MYLSEKVWHRESRNGGVESMPEVVGFNVEQDVSNEPFHQAQPSFCLVTTVLGI